MHVRDWSRAVNSTSTGKFTEMTDEKIIDHLKDLGVTHVQLLPVFDYAQLNSNKNYNWGYNPYHYNVPEGRYVTEGYTDGTQAVKEMRQMIKAFHDAEIAVIMDVVYNHTSATKTGSLYDSTVPEYFYSLDASGNYYSGSGCGNNLDTRRKMVKKYVVESVKQWVNNYHVNGFRFDLMGVLSKDCMKEIYDELYAIDPNILVYGEPWAGGSTGLAESIEATSAGTGTSGYGYGAFDDDFRDAIKGGEYGGLGFGQIQGSYTDNIETGLVGDVITKNKRNTTGITGLALHYAECHDNYTLFDKLIYSTDASLNGYNKEDIATKYNALYSKVMSDKNALNLIKKEDTLAAAYVLLSQGTAFINGGQEFLRTKKGSPDSYAADKKGGITWTNTAGTYNIDAVNAIDLNRKKTYSDVYNTYKMLIAVRKDFNAFTNPSSANAINLASGITKYEVSGNNGNFTVLFNASSDIYKLSDAVEGKVVSKHYVSGILGAGINNSSVNNDVPYALSESTVVKCIPAKSFVIIKTE